MSNHTEVLQLLSFAALHPSSSVFASSPSESLPPLYVTSSLLLFLPIDVQVLELLTLPLPANV